jgi:hypothetical protein
MKKLNEDIRSFLVFEGANIASSSDPTVQLPLTQLRADSRKLQQEISVLQKNSGIQSSMTQQDLADMEGALTFLQRKVRLFQTAGVVSNTGAWIEGFTSGSSNTNGVKTQATRADLIELQTKINAAITRLSSSGTTDSVITARIEDLQYMFVAVKEMITMLDNGTWTDKDIPVYKEDISILLSYLEDQANGEKTGSTKTVKTRATKADLIELQTKIYAAILTLSSSGTTDPVIRTRVKHLQDMYVAVKDMITKLDNGIWTDEDIPVYKEDISGLLPYLANPATKLTDILSSDLGSGKELSPVEKQLSALVGEKNVSKVLNGILEKGTFNISMDLGYNIPTSGSNKSKGARGIMYSKKMRLQPDGTMGSEDTSSKLTGSPLRETEAATASVYSAYDTSTPGMDDRAQAKSNNPSGLDWKKRANSICEQVRLRGLDPLDFGCIAQGSLMSPAYSWRGHTKMICGRLSATTDPDLPRVSGCPPSEWKGWSLSY